MKELIPVIVVLGGLVYMFNASIENEQAIFEKYINEYLNNPSQKASVEQLASNLESEKKDKESSEKKAEYDKFLSLLEEDKYRDKAIAYANAMNDKKENDIFDKYIDEYLNNPNKMNYIASLESNLESKKEDEESAKIKAENELFISLLKDEKFRDKAIADMNALIEKRKSEEMAAFTIALDDNIAHDKDPKTNKYKVRMDASKSNDPDGDKLTYSWSQLSGPKVTLSPNSTAEAVTFETTAGNYKFALTVKDTYNETHTAEKTIKIGSEPNQVPEAVLTATKAADATK